MGVRRLVLETRLRPLAALGHRTLAASELAIERTLVRLAPPPPCDPELLAQLTALVKTFERPQVLMRLVESIKRLYPTLRIVVVDDSRRPTRLAGVETVTMAYDSGIGAGRNEGLKYVQTPYVLILDDDFVFFRGTRLGPALERMEDCRQIDIMGGQVIDLPLLRRRPPPRGEVFAIGAQPVRPLGSRLGGLEVVDKVSQFFLARRDRLELVRWDPRLKRADHADFFTRALGVLTTVFNPNLRCLHARTPFDASYMAKRMDLDESLRILEEKYRA